MTSTFSRFLAQDGQLGAQNGPSCGPRRVQDGPKTASKRLQDGIENEPQKQAQVGSLSGPTWGPRWGHLGAQDGPKRAPKIASTSLQLRIRSWVRLWANLGPKMGQLGPQNQLILKSKNAFRIVIYNIFCVFAMFPHEEYQHGESAQML